MQKFLNIDFKTTGYYLLDFKCGDTIVVYDVYGNRSFYGILIYNTYFDYVILNHTH